MDYIKKYAIRAKKSLGQNFLVDEKILNSMLDNFDINGKRILEVGPGYGALTEKILEKDPENLTLIELDKDMIRILDERFLKNKDKNLQIENIDVLTYIPRFEEFCVVANIPYYITSPILRHFLYNIPICPQNMLILMQKDVGDKILSAQTFGYDKNGEIVAKKQKHIKTSLLGLYIQKKSFVREVVFVPRTSFIPVPKVDSSVLSFEIHHIYDELDDNIFLNFLKVAFAEPRKKLVKNLSKMYQKDDIKKIFSEYNISENARAEELDIAIYCKIIGDFHKI